MDEMQEVLTELRALRQRVAELEAQAIELPAEERSTRRGMLRLAGAAVVGGAAAALLGAEPAAAGTGPMQYGATNDAGTTQTVLNSTASDPTLVVTNTTPDTAVHGSSTGNGSGLEGEISSPSAGGIGVIGRVNGTVGRALVGLGGAAQLYLFPYVSSGAPASEAHYVGEIVAQADGFYACVSGGTPGTWRKFAGLATAGAFHAITPTRVYDSRAAAPLSGLLVAGTDRTISVADGRDNNGAVTTPNLVPAGATAVAANITVTGTTGQGGYLSVNPGGNTSAASSTINWFGAGQNIANGVTLTLNASRQLTAVCGPGGGDTHFIVDIAGYYL